jgi:hypothetical protein
MVRRGRSLVVGLRDPVTVGHRLRLAACDADVCLNGFWELNHGQVPLSCIRRGHTAAALTSGATGQEIMEAIWGAAEMRPGVAYAHSALALDTMAEKSSTNPNPHEAPHTHDH